MRRGGHRLERNSCSSWNLSVLTLGLLLLTPSAAFAQSRVQISKLSDVNAGTIVNVSADITRRQDVCVYSSSPRQGYSVRASGSGVNGAFTLSNGAFTLPYEVQGADFPGATFGYTLLPNISQGGGLSSATSTTCSSGPATTASLIIIIRAIALQSAISGNYSGILTLIITPE